MTTGTQQKRRPGVFRKQICAILQDSHLPGPRSSVLGASQVITHTCGLLWPSVVLLSTSEPTASSCP
eukprot:365252-Chlamydomonas_euryale.AAC.5